jgi:hypothetical protein
MLRVSLCPWLACLLICIGCGRTHLGGGDLDGSTGGDVPDALLDEGVGDVHDVEWVWETGGLLSGVWGSSDSNVYACGIQGKILHYDGSAWSQVESGIGIYGHGQDKVWGSSAEDVYISAYWGYSLSGEYFDCILIHFNGVEWAVVDPGCDPSMAPGPIWGSSATEIFVATDSTLPMMPSPAPDILHFEGASWHQEVLEVGYIVDVRGLWGSSASDVYAVGYGGLIMHLNGEEWVLVERITDERLILEDVWGSSADDVFVVGEKGTILHFDGEVWTEMPSGTNARLTSVWGDSATDVFAAGYHYPVVHEYRSVFLRFDGAEWNEIASDPDALIHDVWGSSSTDVYAVGAYYEKDPMGMGGDFVGAIFHFDGEVWTESWSEGE